MLLHGVCIGNCIFLVAFPLVFQNIYNFKIQFVGLSFVGITVGMIMAASTASFWENMREKAIAANFGGASEPEMRLPQLCVGGIIVPISLFMFAWTFRIHRFTGSCLLLPVRYSAWDVTGPLTQSYLIRSKHTDNTQLVPWLQMCLFAVQWPVYSHCSVNS